MSQPKSDTTPPPAPTASSPAWSAMQEQLAKVQAAVAAANAQLEQVTREVSDAELATFARLREAAERQLAADRAGLDVQRQHVQTLRDQLEKDRAALKAREDELENLQNHFREATRHLDDRAAQLQDAEDDIEQRRKQLDAYRVKLEKRDADFAAAKRDLQLRRETFFAETRHTIKQLRLLQVRGESDVKTRRQALARQEQASSAALLRHKQELERAIAAERAALDRRRHELDRAQSDLEHRGNELDLLQARLNCRAEQLHQRTRRLGEMKQALGRGAKALRKERQAVETSRRCAKQILDQRDGVLDMQRLLLEAEHRMIFRWSLDRSLGWIARGLAAVLLMMTISYLAADQFKTQVWAATAVLNQKQAGAGVEPEAWIAQQRQRVLSDAVLSETISHLHQQGPTLVMSTADLRSMLEKSLRIDSPGAGTLVLELRGEDRAALTPVLSAVLRAVATSHSLVAGPVPEGGTIYIAQPPKLVVSPVASNKLTLAATTFGLIVPVVASVGFVMSLVLRRSQRPEIASLAIAADEEAHWQMLAGQFAETGAAPATIEQPVEDEN